MEKMEEDRLWYQIFVYDGVQIVEDVETLQALAISFMQKISEATAGHIWQHDSFNLTVVSKGDFDENISDDPVHIGGCMRYGDNVEDEWTALSLLVSITRSYTNTVARAWDSDGEVFLIEAAELLPPWLEPETSENRTFLAVGRLHIVPRPSAQAPNLPKQPTLRQGLAAVRANVLARGMDTCFTAQNGAADFCDTEASEEIQAAISRRMEGFPQASVTSERHWSRCYIPIGVAQLLRQCPQLVSAAVRRFYERGPEDLRAATARTRFASDRWVLERVRFTRCLYAQLCKQPFYPPKGYPPLPEPTHPEFKWRSNGLKLACAMEMLYARDPLPADEPACFLAGIGDDLNVTLSESEVSAGKSTGEDVSGSFPSGEVARGTEWERFQRSLSASGYFRGEREGSALYRTLMQQAMCFFAKRFAPRAASTTSLAALMDALIRRTSSSDCVETVPQGAGAVSGPLKILSGGDTGGDDDEAWLDMGPDDLDRLLSDLEKRRNFKPASGTAANSSADGNRTESCESPGQESVGPEVLDRLVEGMTSFGRHVSSFKGAEVPVLGAGIGHKASSGPVDLDADRLMAHFSDAAQGKRGTGESDQDAESSSGSSASDWDRDWDDPEDAEKATSMGDGGADVDESREGLESLGLRELMALMDAELSQSSLAQDFERVQEEHEPQRGEETLKPQSAAEQPPRVGPVDVDANLVKNLLESYKAQAGLAGPASSLYGLMGLRLPDDSNIGSDNAPE